MRKDWLATCVCLALTVAPAARAAGPAVVGRAGNFTVTVEELRLYAGQEKLADITEMDFANRRALLERLLVGKTLAAEAQAKGLDKSPGVGQVLFAWRLENYPAFYWDTQIRDKIKISDEEIRRKIDPKDAYHIRAIAFGEEADGEARAREAHGKLLKGDDFEQTARELSIGFTAKSGGDMGWVPVPNDRIFGDDAKAVEALKAGGITSPLNTPVGWIIYKVEEYRSADSIFNDLKNGVREDVFQEKFDEAKAKRMAEIRNRASIIYADPKAPAGKGTPLAVVNGVAILADSLPPETFEHQFGFRDIDTEKARLEKFINAFLLVQDMERAGLDKLEPLATRYALARIGSLTSAAVEAAVKDKVKVTEEDIKAEYQRYYLPEIYQLQVIFTSQKAKAEEALAKIKAGADFGTVSGEFTEGRLKAKQGMLSPMPLADFPEHVRKAVEAIPNGEYTGVLPNDTWFMIVKRLSSKTITLPRLEDMRSRIRNTLMLRKRSDQVKSFLADLAKKIKITIDEKALAAIK